MIEVEDELEYLHEFPRTKSSCGKSLLDLTTYKCVTLWWFAESGFYLFINRILNDNFANKPRRTKFPFVFHKTIAIHRTNSGFGEGEMGEEIKVLYILDQPVSDFLKNDLDILKKQFKVNVLEFTDGGKKNYFKYLLEMLKGVLWADLTFSWFAGTHAFWAVRLSKIFKKKSIVVVGGYEVAKVPEIGYGAMLNPRSARKVKYVLEKADKILAVSEFNKKETLKYTNPNNVELVYNGIDCDKFKPASGERGDIVMTVVHSISDIATKIKGLETFIKAAKYLPNVKFIVVGEYLNNSIEHLKAMASPNVEFLGFAPNEELIKLYQKAKVYCQLSYRESFGMSIVEAMSCGCIPVVTNRGVLPEIVSDLGFIVEYGDVNGTIKAISNALNSSDKREAIRERAKTLSIIERERDKKDSRGDDIVITVGGINKNTIKRKGMERFVKSARYLPHVRFVIIGGWLDDSIEYLKSIAPQNVKFTGFVSDEELLEWYQKAKVYCQLSLYESFGMALAEAMCCECVPVATNNAALPEVIGDTGFYVPYDDKKATAEAIKKALKSDKGKEARERINNMFPIERREERLVEIIRRSVGAKK